MHASKVQDGHELTEVTKDEFFATLYADPRDIMPSIVAGPYPYMSKWVTNNSARTLFGVSKNTANSAERHYFLVKRAGAGQVTSSTGRATR